MTRQKVQTGMAFLIELAQTMSQFSYSNIKLARAVAERDRLTAQAQAAAEELRRSNQEVEQFGYIASHDLQEPLRQVRSFTQLLQQRYADRLDDKALQYMGFVTEGAARMSDLVQDLLTYSPRWGERAAAECLLPDRSGPCPGQPRGQYRRVPRRHHARPVALRHRRTDPAGPALPEPPEQRHQVSSRRRRAANPRGLPRRRRTLADVRPGQRHRYRPRAPGPRVLDLPVPPRPRQVRRHRHWPGHLQEDRRAARRQDLGGIPRGPGAPPSTSPFRGRWRREKNADHAAGRG